MVTRFLSCLIAFVAGATLARGNQPELPETVGTFLQEVSSFHTKSDGLPSDDVTGVVVDQTGRVTVRTAAGDAKLVDGAWQAMDASSDFASRKLAQRDADRLKIDAETVSLAKADDGQFALAAEDFLLVNGKRVIPEDGKKRWAPTNVSVAFDGVGRFWFASDQGVGRLEGDTWSLFTGAEGLPYDDLTCVACGNDGTAWFGTKIGAIRFDGRSWSYRQGKRWLPNDDVRDIAVDEDGSAWVATAAGLAQIHFRPTTLAGKAEFFETEIDKYHRRTRFGYVIEASAAVPGDKAKLARTTSDNDGLWTSMYGAGECFAYGATKDPKSLARAKQAFEALRFLSEAPKGSPHQPPAGFIARTVLEVSSGRDPNTGAYTLDGQRRMQERDRLWRVYEPRWPKSADGKWYWKSDTSSDELDGHYFFYAAYFDLVAKTDQEKSVVREVVRANIDHLIEHDFSLHDHAGRTRWAVYSPSELNGNPRWYIERGLNSVSMLSYLNVAHHVTGDKKYQDIAKELRDKHSYHINVLSPKFQFGIGSGNQSDDEMAFMAFYNLIKYETDPQLRMLYLYSFANAWRLEEPELNPFFNFCFAAVALDSSFQDNWGTRSLAPWPSWLVDSIDTLKRFPLDRFDWSHTNSHRKDLVMLTNHSAEGFGRSSKGRGYRLNGKVLPVDERHFNHWNTDPWRLDTGGAGHVLADGAVFTLPYYMGLYHGFIAKD